MKARWMDRPPPEEVPDTEMEQAATSAGSSGPMEDIEKDKKRPRKDEDEEAAGEEEFQARVAAREQAEVLAPASPPGPPWLDSVTGLELDPKKVDIGMRAELESFGDFGVADEVSEEEPRKLGRKIISMGWVIRARGDRVKYRIVAQEVNLGQWADALVRGNAHERGAAPCGVASSASRMGDLDGGCVYGVPARRAAGAGLCPTTTWSATRRTRLEIEEGALRAAPKSAAFGKSTSLDAWSVLASSG